MREEVLTKRRHRCTQRVGAAQDHVAWYVVLRSDNHRDLRFDDAGLLGRYVRKGIAEEFDVIKANWCNHGCLRPRDDIRRIELATKSHFKNERVGLVARKSQECRSRRDLEIGDGLALVVAFALLKRVLQLFFRDQLACKPDALV